MPLNPQNKIVTKWFFSEKKEAPLPLPPHPCDGEGAKGCLSCSWPKRPAPERRVGWAGRAGAQPEVDKGQGPPERTGAQLAGHSLAEARDSVGPAALTWGFAPPPQTRGSAWRHLPGHSWQGALGSWGVGALLAGQDLAQRLLRARAPS